MDVPNGNPHPEQLLTVKQVASRLQVSTRKVYRLLAEKAVATVRVGKRGTRVLESELGRYVTSLTERAVGSV
jgi:excisionase family DNA binding protein